MHIPLHYVCVIEVKFKCKVWHLKISTTFNVLSFLRYVCLVHFEVGKFSLICSKYRSGKEAWYSHGFSDCSHHEGKGNISGVCKLLRSYRGQDGSLFTPVRGGLAIRHEEELTCSILLVWKTGEGQSVSQHLSFINRK